MDNLGKERLGKALMELLWWLVTAIITWVIVKPLWSGFVIHDFIYELILFVVVFITYSRYVFGLKYTFLAYFQPMKFALIFLTIPFGFYLIQLFFGYKDFLEKQNEGMVEFDTYFREGLSFNEHYQLLEYLSSMYNFFALSAIIIVIIAPFRLLISYWRVYNKTGMV